MIKLLKALCGWLAARICEHPRVGIGVIVLHGRQILLGMRAGKRIGAGTWQCPGGHLEFLETPENCAVRELFEETSLLGRNAKIVTVTNNPYTAERKHYITIWLSVEVYNISSMQNREPDKCERWEWFDIDNIPSPLFEPSGVLDTQHLEQIIQNRCLALQKAY